MSFDKIFDLTAGVYFNFYNNIQKNQNLPKIRVPYICLDRIAHRSWFCALAGKFNYRTGESKKR